MSFDPATIAPPGARIKVIGVGGGGGNAVNTMIRSGLEGVDFVTCNTDVQALKFSLAPHKIQIGKELTRGLGAGADPDVGRDAALEDRHEIQDYLTGADMVFITAGMGGGTGTGGASVVAQIARELGALTVAVVTKPFAFEGKRRRKHGDSGIQRLRECVDTLITIPNQRLLQVAAPGVSMVEAFKMADDVLVNAVKGISDIINIPGTVNVDFADVKTVMSCMGQALMGIGRAKGESRALEAARQAISSPLLEDIDIEGATGILINITAGSDITLMEVNEACSIIQEAAHEDANIIFGAVIDETLGDEIRVTVIATGFPTEASEDEGAGDGQGSKSSSPIIQPYGASRLTMPSSAKPLVRPAPVTRPATPAAQPAAPVAQPQPAPSQPIHHAPVAQPAQPAAPVVTPPAPLAQPSVSQTQAPATHVPSVFAAPAQAPMMHATTAPHITPSAFAQSVATAMPAIEPLGAAAPQASTMAPLSAPIAQPVHAAPLPTPSFQGASAAPEGPRVDLTPSEPAHDELTDAPIELEDIPSLADDAQALAAWTFEAADSLESGEALNLDASEPTADEPVRLEGARLLDQQDDDFSFAPRASHSPLAIFDAGLEEADARQGAEAGPEAPLETFFAPQGEPGVLATDIDKKIDEALELAEKLRTVKQGQAGDDLDVPAFLRQGVKDLTLG